MYRFLAIALILLAGPALGHPVGAQDTPDDTLTPGVVRTDLTDEQIRTTRWGLDRRAVTPAMKAEVFRRYHVTGDHDPSCGAERCEVDHRVPRSCGGADDVNNLWAQSSPSWHQKDRLEALLARQVKSGAITPAQCRAVFLGDWRAAYARYFGGP